jgi:diguanylate cyclase (GGDEF)-like protein
VASFRDVTDLKVAEANLSQLARYDQLTGLPNRRLCLERLASAAARVRRAGEPDLAVLFLDLDGFKHVNDRLGHAAGDELLVVIADRIRKVLRPTDLVARFGGDEFVVVAEPIAGVAGAEALARRVGDAVRPPVQLGHVVVQVTASTGIALAGPGDTADALLAQADTALYRAKDHGRDRFELYDERMRARARRRIDLEADLRRAIATGGLEVHFQPEVALADGRIAAFEALVRWGHPELGALEPEEFVALAEDTGLIGSLGAAVLGEAFGACARWHRIGHAARVAVNLSGRQLGHPGLVEQLAAAMETAGVEPAWVVFEVTETALQEPGVAALDALRRLRELGCAVALDDFGVGSSTLAALQDLPVDLVKLDRRFLERVPEDAAATAVVRACVQLAHARGLQLIAEGVEREEQRALLADLGCDLVQGYAVGRPMAEVDLVRLVAGG